MIEHEVNNTPAVLMLATGSWDDKENSLIFARSKDTNEDGNYQYEAFSYFDGGSDPQLTGWHNRAGNLTLNCRDIELDPNREYSEDEKFEKKVFDAMKQAENPFNLLTASSLQTNQFPFVQDPDTVFDRLKSFLPENYIGSEQAVKDFWASDLYIQHFELRGEFDQYPNKQTTPFMKASKLFHINPNPYISSLRWKNGKFDSEFANEIINIFYARFSRICKKWKIVYPHKLTFNPHYHYKYRVGFLHEQNTKNYERAKEIAENMLKNEKWTQEQYDEANNHFKTFRQKIGLYSLSYSRDTYARYY